MQRMHMLKDNRSSAGESKSRWLWQGAVRKVMSVVLVFVAWTRLAAPALVVAFATVGLAADQRVTQDPNQSEAYEFARSQEEIRQDAWERIQPHLTRADQQTLELNRRLVERIDTFFERRSQGAAAFAETALGWLSTWKLITDSDGHRDFLKEQFARHIFSAEELASLLKAASTEYSFGLREIQNELLVNAGADLEELPAPALPAFANGERLANRFDNLLAEATEEVPTKLSLGVGQLIGTEIVCIWAPMAVIGSTSWAAGAGIIVAIVLDRILEWLHHPADDLSVQVARSLDEVKARLLSGEARAWSIHDRLGTMAKDDPSPAVRARAAEAVAKIEQGGALGLKHALSRFAKARNEARMTALRQTVYPNARLSG